MELLNTLHSHAISQTAAVHETPLQHPGISIATVQMNRGTSVLWLFELCKHWAPLFSLRSLFSLSSSLLP